MYRSVFVSIILLAVTAPVYAGVVITEIMYDLEGADTVREWVEIQNTDAEVDLTGWKFFENGTNHGLNIFQGNILLPQNGFAVIADSAEKFLLDWPGFSGTIFESSFSLSNTGETLILRDTELADKDSVAYLSDWGANGDGKSLQKVGNEWVATSPAPGEGPESQTASENQSSGATGPVTMAESISKLKAYAGEDRTVLAGAEVGFSASAEGFTEDSINKARFSWNFGDGYIGEGKNTAHAFLYPGIYSVLLNVLFSGNSASDSAKITAVENPVVISEIKPGAFLEIYNNSPRKIDFSGFGIGLGDSKPFYFPAGTFLQPYAHLALNGELLGFQLARHGTIKLLYPNNKILFSSIYTQLSFEDAESLNLADGKWFAAKATPGAKNNIPAKSKTTQATNGPQTKVAENPKPNSEIAAASVINIEHSNGWGKLLKENYFWLFMGLGAGILAGLGAILGKRYLA